MLKTLKLLNNTAISVLQWKKNRNALKLFKFSKIYPNRRLFSTFIYSYSVSFLIPTWFNSKEKDLNLKYWKFDTSEKAIYEADRLYQSQQFLQAYELLNRIKFSNNPEILWRIVRSIYKLSCVSEISSEIQKNMISEATDIISHALQITDDNANVHKWAAIILDCKFNLEGVKSKINGLAKIKHHISRAVELDNSQTSLLFMLGKLSYDLANLTWFQKKLANVLFAEIPDDSFEAAYNYFREAEERSPGFYIGNLLMLGKTSMKLGKLHRAKYYFNMATQITVVSEADKKLQAEAAELAKSLTEYETQVVFE